MPREGWSTVVNAVDGYCVCPLVHRAGSHHTRIQLDLTKCAFVPGYILLQDGRQGFGLLRTQINSLEIIDLHLRLALLQKRAEYQKEVPDVHPHLHAVGIILAIVGSIAQFDIGLNWVRHKSASVAGLPRGNNVPSLITSVPGHAERR